jgi:hypothetical protein
MRIAVSVLCAFKAFNELAGFIQVELAFNSGLKRAFIFQLFISLRFPQRSVTTLPVPSSSRAKI